MLHRSIGKNPSRHGTGMSSSRQRRTMPRFLLIARFNTTRRCRRIQCVLKNTYPTAPTSVWRQQLHYRHKEGALIAAVAACLFLLMTLLSYSSNDPAWDVSVKVHSFENAGGMIGAWLSSILLASLGYFAYLFPLLLGIRAWRIFRNRHQQWHWNGLQFVWHLTGVAGLGAAGTVLADIHFVAQEGMQDSGGGMLGDSLGAWTEIALGVQGSTLMCIGVLLFGLTVFPDLSWFRVMDLTGKITLA